MLPQNWLLDIHHAEAVLAFFLAGLLFLLTLFYAWHHAKKYAWVWGGIYGSATAVTVWLGWNLFAGASTSIYSQTGSIAGVMALVSFITMILMVVNHNVIRALASSCAVCVYVIVSTAGLWFMGQNTHASTTTQHTWYNVDNVACYALMVFVVLTLASIIDFAAKKPQRDKIKTWWSTNITTERYKQPGNTA